MQLQMFHFSEKGVKASENPVNAGVGPGIFRRGVTPPTMGLKYGFQGTINAKNLRKTRVSPSDGGLACSDGGYSP